MSRVANNPVKIPDGVTISLLDNEISVKGSKGSLSVSYTHLTLPTKRIV